MNTTAWLVTILSSVWFSSKTLTIRCWLRLGLFGERTMLSVKLRRSSTRSSSPWELMVDFTKRRSVLSQAKFILMRWILISLLVLVMRKRVKLFTYQKKIFNSTNTQIITLAKVMRQTRLPLNLIRNLNPCTNTIRKTVTLKPLSMITSARVVARSWHKSLRRLQI